MNSADNRKKDDIQSELSKLSESFNLPKDSQKQIRNSVLAQISNITQDQKLTLVKKTSWTFGLARLSFALAVVFVILSGAVYASSQALPGTALYKLKMAKENVELNITPSPQKKAYIKANHAQERLNELKAIDNPQTPQSQQPQKEEALGRAKTEVNQAINSLQKVEKDYERKGNNDNASEIRKKIEDLSNEAKKQGVKIEDNQGKPSKEDKRSQNDKERRQDNQQTNDSRDSENSKASRKNNTSGKIELLDVKNSKKTEDN